ncbi:MAG: hypothetical protein U9O95_05660 [Candidatus Marinimicrobia bacterium]|nr:hypothetical protein [Candidatus Neomarinimicrobiota bacterium]
MKNFIRMLIIAVLSFSLVLAATFPRGIITFKDGAELKVKKVSIQDNFVYYKLKGEKLSALLEDVEFVKVRGKFERAIGGITGGATLLVIGGVSTFVGMLTPEIAPKLAGLTVGFTAVGYIAGRLVGSVFDPWRKIYKAPIPE